MVNCQSYNLVRIQIIYNINYINIYIYNLLNYKYIALPT